MDCRSRRASARAGTIRDAGTTWPGPLPPAGTPVFAHTVPHELQARGSRQRLAAQRNPVLLLEVVSVRERMGSGGPLGLQILMSDAFGVRGGFDSHAFPPD